MHRAWFTADGRSRVDYGLADVWHYRASNNSWNRERARRREGEEACRNWSLWKENNFDLLSINKNKKHLWVCAGGLRANNRSTGTWNIYNLWQVFRAPVLLRASWMIQDSPPTRHRPNMWNCRNVKKSCMCAEKKKKILLPCQQVSTKNQELRGWKRKERREYHRHVHRDVSARLFSTGHEAPDDIDPAVQIKYECEERRFRF